MLGDGGEHKQMACPRWIYIYKILIDSILYVFHLSTANEPANAQLQANR